MKIGTTPKITVGAIGLVGLLFIGIGVHHILPKSDSAKDTAASVQAEAPSEALVETDTNQETENRENQPQISDKDMEQIKGFFAQLEAEDAQSDARTVPSTTDAEVTQGTDQSTPTEPSTTLAATTQSAEEVMNTYVDAFQNLDFETIPLFLTGTAREEFEWGLPILKGELTEKTTNLLYSTLPEEEADKILQIMREMMQSMNQQMFGQMTVVSSGYVGDEFHFRLRTPAPEIPVMSGGDIVGDEFLIQFAPPAPEEMPEIPDSLHKMRKEDGMWVIYDTN